MKIKINSLKHRKGIALLELLIVIPMISIILILTYNMFFMSIKSFKYVNESFNKGEDIRSFTINIQKEANQAKKANDNTVLYKPKKDHKELYIYTDTDDDGIPELIRYKVLDKNILKGTEKAINDKFPFKYKEDFNNEKVVLSNVKIDQIFGDIEKVEENNKYVDENDHRRMCKMIIEIDTGSNNTPIVINTVLVNKSRASFED